MTGETASTTSGPTDRVRLDVVIVASWFPAYDDPAAGRFVADQVDALAATGAVRATVISFDPARLSGGATSRGRQADVVLAAGRDGAARADPLFVAGLPGLEPSIRVARLTIPEGLTRNAGRAHGAAHRTALLTAAADRLVAAVGDADGSAAAGDAAAGPAGVGIVHAHTGYPDGAAAIALADRLGWPLFVTEHSSFVEKQIGEPAVRERYSAVLRRASRLFAVSTMLADELRTAFPEQADRIAVLPNAVPVDAFPLTPLDRRRADELLFVGYWKASKGIETLLRATALAHSARPSIRLRLVGRTADEDEERGWHELAASLGIADVVAFDTTRHRAGVAEAMAEASVFVHPSPRETFGVVAVEALATGMPVVATDSGGVTEILGPAPDLLGALVQPDDPAALAEAILATLDRRESFDPEALRSAVERRFGAAFVAERLLTEYREAIAGRSGGAALAPPAEDAAVVTPGPVVVVALDRERAAARLAAVPDAVRTGTTLVTAVEPRDRVLPAVGRLVEVDVDPSWRTVADRGSLRRRPGMLGRVARLVTDPRGTVDRWRGRDAGAEESLAPATDAVRRLAADGPIEVIPIDGHDHVAIEPLVQGGLVRRADGGLRRRMDLVDASTGPR